MGILDRDVDVCSELGVHSLVHSSKPKQTFKWRDLAEDNDRRKCAVGYTDQVSQKLIMNYPNVTLI